MAYERARNATTYERTAILQSQDPQSDSESGITEQLKELKNEVQSEHQSIYRGQVTKLESKGVQLALKPISKFVKHSHSWAFWIQQITKMAWKSFDASLSIILKSFQRESSWMHHKILVLTHNSTFEFNYLTQASSHSKAS